MLNIRFKAAAVHLLSSIIAISIFIGLIIWFWYPSPYFQLESSITVIQLVVLIDVILGPGLTLLVYKPGKPGLKMDMTIIIGVQLIALLWGGYVTYVERPLYVGFNIDRFTVLSGRNLDMDKLNSADLYNNGWGGPLFVYVLPPQGVEEKSEFVKGMLANEKELVYRTERYRNIESDVYQDKVFSRGIAVEKLIQAQLVSESQIAKELSVKPPFDELVFFPIEGRKLDATIIFNKVTKTYVGILHIDPWKAFPKSKK